MHTEKHRKCDGCNRRSCESSKTHPYLKRRSTTVTAADKSSESLPEMVNTKDTGFPNIDKCMSEAREKYAAHPELRPKVEEARVPVPTPEDLGTNERLDYALTKSSELLAEAIAGLESRHDAPFELTASERFDQAAAKSWAKQYEDAEAQTESVLNMSGDFAETLKELIDSIQIKPEYLEEAKAFLEREMKGIENGEKILAKAKAKTGAELAAKKRVKETEEPSTESVGSTPTAEETSKATEKPQEPKQKQRSNTSQRAPEWQTLWIVDKTFRW